MQWLSAATALNAGLRRHMLHPVDSSHFPQNRWSRRLQSDANVLHMAEVDQQRILQRSVVLPSFSCSQALARFATPDRFQELEFSWVCSGTAREHDHS